MKLLKNNLKLFIGILIGSILAGGIVYAAVSASEINYTTDKNANIKNVAEALNDLYKDKKETSDDIKNITSNGEHVLDKYYKNINVNVGNSNNTDVELAFDLNVKSDGFNSSAEICVRGFKSVRIENKSGNTYGNRTVRAIYNGTTYTITYGQETTILIVEGIDNLHIDSSGTSSGYTASPKVYLMMQ